ncbi:hypothetical protein RJZ56_001096 [Blastomyces dermatitidis]
MLAIYPLLKPTSWGKWQWNGPAGWQEEDEKTGEEPDVSSTGGRADDPKDPQQIQGPTTFPWISRWAQEAELSDSTTSVEKDSHPDDEEFVDRRSSKGNRNTAPDSAALGDDSLPKGDWFIAQTPAEDDTGLTMMAAFEQGCGSLNPLQGLDSFCISEDIEMIGCEPVEILEEEKVDWEWSGVPSPYPRIQQPLEPPLETKPEPYTIWLAPRAPIPPPVGQTKEQEVEAVNFLLAISRDHPQL